MAQVLLSAEYICIVYVKVELLKLMTMTIMMMMLRFVCIYVCTDVSMPVPTCLRCACTGQVKCPRFDLQLGHPEGSCVTVFSHFS